MASPKSFVDFSGSVDPREAAFVYLEMCVLKTAYLNRLIITPASHISSTEPAEYSSAHPIPCAVLALGTVQCLLCAISKASVLQSWARGMYPHWLMQQPTLSFNHRLPIQVGSNFLCSGIQWIRSVQAGKDDRGEIWSKCIKSWRGKRWWTEKDYLFF